MAVAQNDVIGIVIHVHGKYHSTAAQRRALETVSPRATIDVDGKKQTVMEALPRPCPGRVYAIMWLFLVNLKKGTAQRKRERIMEFVDEVRCRGAEILEVGSGRRTSDTKQRRAMLSEAFEAVTRGRQPSQTSVRGRKPRQLTDASKEIIWNEWHSVRNETNDDAAAAASRRLKIDIDQFVMWHVVREMRRAAGDANATGASGRPFRKSTRPGKK